jgi:hypothetical protein
MTRPNPKEAYIMRVRRLIKDVYSKLGGRREELVIIHGFHAFKVKRADREVTILQSIFDDYFSDKRREAQESCIKRIKEDLKNLLQ